MCTACDVRLSRRLFCAGGAVAACLPGIEVAPVEPAMRLVEPVVALTLDACPGGFDTRIAHVLVENAIPATIFVTAIWMRQNPAPLAYLLAHRDVFALENHGAQHVPPVLGGRRIFGIQVAGDMAAIAREVSGGSRAVQDATGSQPRWYRAATGFYSPAALPAITADGTRIGAYSLNADMGASLPATHVARRIAAAKPGDVIVGHINQQSRPSGQGIVEGVLALKQRGAMFVHLDDRAIVTPGSIA